MSRAGSYGQSFALKYLHEGRCDEALAAANAEIDRDPSDPEPVLDRAQILLTLERFEDAVEDIRRCLELDRVAMVVDDSVLDDTLFSALVRWGQREAERDPEAAVRILRRYTDIFPAGGHGEELESWAKRFRGHAEMWVKER